MNKLRAFVHLDFLTIKPYLTPRSLLIYLAVVLVLSFTSGDAMSGLSIGMMLGTLFVSYPFAIGEKSNMDALYVTLSVNRNTVVLGRYLFALALNVAAMAFAFILGTISVLAKRAFGLEIASNDSGVAILLVSAVFIFIQAVQLPLCFKLGYSKAKFFTLIPLAALAGFYGMILGGKQGGVFDLSSLMNGGTTTLLLATAALCVIVILSYTLSKAFYAMREF